MSDEKLFKMMKRLRNQEFGSKNWFLIVNALNILMKREVYNEQWKV